MHLSEREKHILGQSPQVSKEDFLEHLWKLRPVGSPEDAYIWTGWTVAHGRTFTGGPVSFSLIVGKYKEYLDHCQRNSMEEKYISTIKGFVERGRYNDTWPGADTGLLERFGIK
jgi:hypothetical protein